MARFWNQKRYFGSFIFVVAIGIVVQIFLLLANITHMNLLYRVLYAVFVFYARYTKYAHLPHLPNHPEIPQHHLCTSIANQTVSCEHVGYEMLLSLVVPQWNIGSEKTFIPGIRTNIGAPLILKAPFGAIYEEHNIHNLSCFLVHSHYSDYQHLSEIYKKGVIIYLHGGAFVSGTAKVLHRFMTYLHLFVDLPVIGVDYHLAPEYPLQSGQILEDGHNIIIKYFNDEMGVDLKNIYLIGDSAGGAIVLLLMQYLSINNYTNIGGGVMISPGIDLDNDAELCPSLINNDKYDVFLSRNAISFFKEFVFGCRDVNGEINRDIAIDGNITKCVEIETSKMKKYFFDKESWKNMDINTNMLFTASEYEILIDGIVNVYKTALNEFNINADLYIAPKSNIHALPMLVGAPEALKAISHIAHIMKTWIKRNE